MSLNQIPLLTLWQLELKNNLRRYAELLLPVGFFLLLICFFSLTLDTTQINTMIPSAIIIWVAMLLSLLLSTDRLFLDEYQSGHLLLLRQSLWPLPFILLMKIINQWLTTMMPMLFVSPLIMLFYPINIATYGLLMCGLGLGSIALICLNALGSALTLGLNQRGILLTLLMLPLQLPIVLLGLGLVHLHAQNHATLGVLSLLAALSLALLCLSPLLCAYCLAVNET